MRQLQVRLAALVGLLPLTAFMVGCDSESGRADTEVLRLIAEADKANEPGKIPALENASRVNGASPVAKAHVHALLGNAELKVAREHAAVAATHAATIARLLTDLDRITVSLVDAQNAQANLKKFEPATPKQAVATKQKEINEGTNGLWIAPLPSLTATKASEAELTAKISETEGKIKGLNDQRAAALAEAERLEKESAGAKGQASVDLYKNASAKRKEAMDLAAQADVLTTSLVPLRQDLAIAQGQQQHRTTADAGFAEQGTLLDKGWADVQAASAKIAADAKELVEGADTNNKPGVTAGKSATVTGAALTAELAKYDEAVAEANNHYDNAINHFGLAASAAQTVSGDLAKSIGERSEAPEVVAFKSQQNTFTPASYNLQKGLAQQEVAMLLGHKAELNHVRGTTLTELGTALAAGGFTAPAGTSADGVSEAAKADATKATEAYTNAVETLRTIAEAGGSTTAAREAKAAASVTLMLTEHAWSQFAAATGDATAAKSHLDAAIAIRGELRQDENTRLPALPPALALAKAAPAAVPGTPATPTSPTE